MNYQKIYDDICKRGQVRILPKEVYTEKHHIIPKCLGGNNSKDNLTVLTAREHFICHLILTRIHPKNRKVWYAVWRMCVPGRDYQKRYVPSSRIYEEIRNKCSALMSGESNPMYGRPLSDDHKLKISISQVGKTVSEETKRKISATNSKILHTPEWGEKISQSKKNISIETRQKLSLSQKGKTRSDEFKENLRKLMSGVGNHNFGKTFSNEYRKKLSDNSGRRRPIVINGIIFKQATDAAIYFNMTQGNVTYRVMSQCKKWENWKYLNQTEFDEKNHNYTDLREQSFS